MTPGRRAPWWDSAAAACMWPACDRCLTSGSGSVEEAQHPLWFTRRSVGSGGICVCYTEAGAVIINVSIVSSGYSKVLQSLSNPTTLPPKLRAHKPTWSLVRAHGHAICAACCCMCQGSAPIIHIDSWRRGEQLPGGDNSGPFCPSAVLTVWFQRVLQTASLFATVYVQPEDVNSVLGGGLGMQNNWIISAEYYGIMKTRGSLGEQRPHQWMYIPQSTMVTGCSVQTE